MKKLKVFYFSKCSFFAISSLKPAYIIEYFSLCASMFPQIYTSPLGRFTDAVVRKKSIKIVDSGKDIGGIHLHNSFIVRCAKGGL